MTTLDDLVLLHRRALDDMGRLLAATGSADLTRPTPCAEWDLQALIGHLIGQNLGFAAAMATGDAEPEAYRSRPPSADAAGSPAGLERAWEASVRALTDAVTSATGASQVGGIRLVEISDSLRFPLAMVLTFQLLDTAVHAWDVAASLGRAYRPDSDVLAVVLSAAAQIPTGANRLLPGAAFAPPLSGSAGAGMGEDGGDSGEREVGAEADWRRALALVGRSSHWQPAELRTGSAADPVRSGPGR
jgi:uncharacterized protein (TIGR03086 family)